MAARADRPKRKSMRSKFKEAELFDHVLVIQLHEKGNVWCVRVLVVYCWVDGKPNPTVGYRFPPLQDTDDGEAKTIVQFCFPEEDSFPIQRSTPQRGTQKKKSETFSFVLTATDGSKRFGYCRRFMHLKPPECFCIISLVYAGYHFQLIHLHRPSFSLFTQLLDIVEERRKTSSLSVFSFLKVSCL